MKLADKILQLRKQNGMSQEELAEKLGVSRQAVSRWEAGSAQPEASNVFAMSRLFGVTTDELLDDACDLTEKRQDVPRPGKLRLAALCAAGVGLLGNAAIYLASRFVKAKIPYIYEENGETWYEWSLTGYSYKYFIQEHSLELVTAAFFVLFFAGLLIAFVDRERARALWRAILSGIKKIKKRFQKAPSNEDASVQ